MSATRKLSGLTPDDPTGPSTGVTVAKPSTQAPTAPPRGASPAPHRALADVPVNMSTRLPGDLLDELDARCARLGVTKQMAVLAALDRLLDLADDTLTVVVEDVEERVQRSRRNRRRR